MCRVELDERMHPAAKYAEPFFWWGPAWASAAVRGIGHLLRDETIDATDAALVWAALARRRSLAVIAGPSGVGKSTLLGGLLDLLPCETRRVYIRGCFETFAFLSDRDVVPVQSALVVNEISPHLPVYLWGPAVGRMLDTSAMGFMLLATAHAESVATFVSLLSAPPLRIDAPRAALFEFVVLLERVCDNASGRRVQGVWRLLPAPNGVIVDEVSPRAGETGVAAVVPEDELAMRVDLLRRLQTGEIAGTSELHAIAAGQLPPILVEPAANGRVASRQARIPVRKRDSTLDQLEPR